MSIKQLVYKSKASEFVNRVEIAKLLSTSRTNNDKYDITGILIYYNDRFLQVIEGPPTDISKLFYNIIIDPRNYDVELLQEKTVFERDFINWSMAFVDIGELENIDVIEVAQLDNITANKGSVMLIIRNFIRKYHDYLDCQ